MPFPCCISRAELAVAARRSVRSLSLAGHGGTSVHGVSVGCPAFGSRGPRPLSWLFSAANLALSLAAVSSDVSFRGSQTSKRRLLLAKLHGIARALPNAAHANTPGLVLLSIARMVPAFLRGLRIFCRTDCAVPDFRAAPRSLSCGRVHHVLAVNDSSDRQLRVFQRPYDCIVYFSLGRQTALPSFAGSHSRED